MQGPGAVPIDKERAQKTDESSGPVEGRMNRAGNRGTVKHPLGQGVLPRGGVRLLHGLTVERLIESLALGLGIGPEADHGVDHLEDHEGGGGAISGGDADAVKL